MKEKFTIIIFTFMLFSYSINCPANNQEMPYNNTLPSNTSNIILITINSLRADHVSCLGYHRQTTPNFDKFSKNSILFTNAFATSSWQMPAIGSIFTSLYPSEHGATHIANKLNTEITTLAEILKANGYYTAGFNCNPRLTTECGFDKGFHYYDDYSISLTLPNASLDPNDIININRERTNDMINSVVFRWLQNNTHRPFFLSVHYYDNHWDYLPPQPYNTLFDPNYTGNIDGTNISKEPLYSNKPCDKDTEHIIALYDGEVKQTDCDLGSLVAFLKHQNIFKDSMIIIIGDHGEQFYEHGHTSHHGIFDELIHVPLAISFPDINEPDVINSLASGLDIMPTILDYTGLPVPLSCTGQSLVPITKGDHSKKREFVFAEYTGGAVPDCYAVRFKNYKFIYEENEIFAYNLLADPTEQKKIYKLDFTIEMNSLFEKTKHLLIKNKSSVPK